MKAGLVDPASTGLKDVDIQELFKNGQITFDVAGWAGNLALYNDKDKSKVAGSAVAALMPSVTARAEPSGFPVPSGSPRPRPTRRRPAPFINWLLQPENQTECYTALGNLPTRTTVLDALDKAGKLAGGKVLIEEAALVEPLFARGLRAGTRSSRAPPRPPSTRSPRARCRSTMPSRRLRREPPKP